MLRCQALRLAEGGQEGGGGGIVSLTLQRILCRPDKQPVHEWPVDAELAFKEYVEEQPYHGYRSDLVAGAPSGRCMFA